jgi:hypothetical protein
MGGRTDVHDEEPSGRPSVVSENLVQSERRRFTISEFSLNFHKFRARFPASLSHLGAAVTSFAQDGFRKCSWMRTKRREWIRL